MRDRFLEHGERRPTPTAFPVNAADPDAGIETAQDVLQLGLADQTALIGGHQVVTFAVLIFGALGDEALRLSDITDVDNVPKHPGMAVAFQHVADSSLPRPWPLVGSTQQWANDMARANAECRDPEFFGLRVHEALGFGLAHGVGDFPVTFDDFHRPLFFWRTLFYIHIRPAILGVNVPLLGRMPHGGKGTGVHESLNRA